jgi:hypothetical protein
MDRFRNRGSILCCLALLLLVAAVPAFADRGGTHTLNIVVLDSGGSVVPDAQVIIEHADGEAEKLTAASDGTHRAATQGDKATLLVGHPAVGQATVDLDLADADRVVDIALTLQQRGVAIARTLGDLRSSIESVEGGGVCGPGNGDCCIEGGNGTPGCDDAECCNAVCAIDPFCCDTSWDGICAGEAAGLCAVCGAEPGACCFLGGNCVDGLTELDCSSQGGTFQGPGTDCGGIECPLGPCPGEGDCCEPNGTPGCDDAECCNAVCTVDPFCCDVEWDSICADEAGDICAVCAPIGACCLDLETCVDMLSPDMCAGMGGIFQGDGTVCDQIDCAALGGCDCDKMDNQEGEGCGGDTNGGCNAPTPVFTDAACGDTWCGSSFADGGTRDTDWYLITLTETSLLSAELRSEFPGVCFIVDGIAACAPVVVGDIGCSDGCELIQTASAVLAPGDYVVFVSTGDCAGGGIFDGIPCGSGINDYTVFITCTPVSDEGGCCFPDGSCQDLTEGDCTAAGGVFQGLGTNCDGVFCTVVPDNDLCENAEPLDVGPGGEVTVMGDTLAATFDGVPTCGTSNTAPGVWYSVIGNGNTMTATTCNQADFDTKISIFCGDCPEGGGSDCCIPNGTPGCDDPECEAAVCAVDPFCCDVSWDGICADQAADLCAVCAGEGGLICVDGLDDTPGCDGFTTEISWCAAAGARYLVLIHGFGAATGLFTLTVSDNGSQCAPTVECPVGCETDEDCPPGFVCIDGDCVAIPTGACCLSDGSCVDGITQADCEAEGGEYQGDGTTCQGGFLGYVAETCDNPFVDISQTGTEAPNASNSDDDGDVVGMGFAFTFFGNTYNEVGVASNGYLTFGGDLSDFTNDPIPTPEDPNDAIFPWWDDWSPNQGGTVVYQEFADPNRFMVQWTDVPHFSGSGNATFQAILFESGVIEFRYGDPLNLDSPTVGIENIDGTDGVAVDPAGIGPGSCYRFVPQFEDPIECEPAPTGIEGTLVIKQGACPAPVNPGSNGVVQMVLVGDADLDVTQVDLATVQLSRCDGVGGSVTPNVGPPGPSPQFIDLNHPVDGAGGCESVDPCACGDNQSSDGITDLKHFFRTDDMAEAGLLDGTPGEIITLVLTGALTDGTTFEAANCIRLAGAGGPPGVVAVEATNAKDVWIDASPLDETLDGGGFDTFQRVYPLGTVLSLSVDPALNTKPVLGWKVDGQTLVKGESTLIVVVDDHHTIEVIFGDAGWSGSPGEASPGGLGH